MIEQPKCPCPDARVPQDATCRAAVVRAAQERVSCAQLVVPLSLDALREHASAIACDAAVPDAVDYAMVMLHNAAWSDEIAKIPFERRMFLLPPCLRDQARCKAEADEFGLLCVQCGACPIGEFSAMSEELGYTTMVADNASVAKELIRDGAVDAVVGVSCMETLEKMFPELNVEAVPSLALPLLRCGCRETTLDTNALRDLLKICSPQTAYVTPQALRDYVKEFFTPEVLEKCMALTGRAEAPESATEKMVLDYLAEDGKRWRPLLMLATYQALCGCSLDAIPDRVRRLAVAVECFHKASIIHDDIEDGDLVRNGYETLHARTSVAMAINAGDLLLGEGYRLIAGCGYEPAVVQEILACAADGHRQLCLGQGAELIGRPADDAAIIEIFCRKTSPAFAVALQWGVLCAAADSGVSVGIGALQAALVAYSDALGIAYQIHDDIADKDSQLTDPAALLEEYRAKTLTALEFVECAALKIFLTRFTRRVLE